MIKWLTIASINFLIFVFLFLFLEASTRIFFPNFLEAIDYDIDEYSRVRQNTNHHHITIQDKNITNLIRLPFRSKSLEPILETETKKIGIIGDSVTYGHSLSYEDIFWVRLQRLLKLTKSNNIQVISMGNIASNYEDTLTRLKYMLEKHNENFSTIIYQFNYNDITPYNQKAIKNIKNDNTKVNVNMISIYKTFMQWWHRNMFNSAFLRAAQHFGGGFLRSNSGNCEDRGFNALNQYSWAYGSKSIIEESKVVWKQYSVFLKKALKLVNAYDAEFVILVSPLMYHIDKEKFHPSFEHLKLDFTCATINPLEKLKAIAKEYNIKVLDPTDYVRAGFIARIKEGNGEPFYFIGDDNHPNSIASEYIAEYLAGYFLRGEL